MHNSALACKLKTKLKVFKRAVMSVFCNLAERTACCIVDA